MITQKEFRKLRPDSLGDHWTLEFSTSRDCYDTEYLGGFYDCFESHGVTMGFGQKVKRQLAYIEVIPPNPEITDGCAKMTEDFMAGLNLPFHLEESPEAIGKVVSNLKSRGKGYYSADLDWALTTFYFQNDQLSQYQVLDLDVCERNVYAAYRCETSIRDILTLPIPDPPAKPEYPLEKRIKKFAIALLRGDELEQAYALDYLTPEEHQANRESLREVAKGYLKLVGGMKRFVDLKERGIL